MKKMNEVVMQSDLVAVLDHIVETLCPRKLKWSPCLGHRMSMITSEYADPKSICIDELCGADVSDPAEVFLTMCTKSFENSVQEERQQRIESAVVDAAQNIENGILTAAQVMAVVQDLANRREQLALGGVHPLDLVSDAEVAEFSAYLGEALRKEVIARTY